MCENVWEAVLPRAGVASTSLLTERPICSRVKHPLISLCQNDQVCFATGPPTQKHTRTHTQTHSHTQSPGELSLLFTHADAHIKMCMKSEKFRRTHRHTSTLSLSPSPSIFGDSEGARGNVSVGGRSASVSTDRYNYRRGL